MDGSMFRFPIWPFFVGLAAIFLSGFASGYGCGRMTPGAGCGYHLRSPVERTSK
jgi:hypothetical protein